MNKWFGSIKKVSKWMGDLLEKTAPIRNSSVQPLLLDAMLLKKLTFILGLHSAKLIRRSLCIRIFYWLNFLLTSVFSSRSPYGYRELMVEMEWHLWQMLLCLVNRIFAIYIKSSLKLIKYGPTANESNFIMKSIFWMGTFSLEILWMEYS